MFKTKKEKRKMMDFIANAEADVEKKRNSIPQIKINVGKKELMVCACNQSITVHT